MDDKRYHRTISHLLKFFSYEHLPDDLQGVSKLFCDVAYQMAELSPQSIETTACLRKLLESKDAAVRAVIETDWYQEGRKTK